MPTSIYSNAPLVHSWTWGYEEMLKGIYKAFGEMVRTAAFFCSACSHLWSTDPP